MELSHAKCPSCRVQAFSYNTKKQRGFCYSCGKPYAEENMDKDLDAEGFQLTHPDLNNTEDKPMDATKIKVGDKVRLRNGKTYTVTGVSLPDEISDYSVILRYKYGCGIYTARGHASTDGNEYSVDIVEIIPAETSEETTDDIVNKPSHYTQYEIEPVTFIMANRLPFEIGNIVKYACRAGSKLYPGQDYKQSRITDLRKVMRYAEMEINRLEGKDVL